MDARSGRERDRADRSASDGTGPVDETAGESAAPPRRASAGSASRNRPRMWWLVNSLRTAAFAFLLVGFYGTVTRGASPVAADSVPSIVFLTGVACAGASIYVGIFLHDGAGDG